MALAMELGLGTAFTLISLAPFIPSWIKEAESQIEHTKVRVGVGIPHLNEGDYEHKDDIYGTASYGGSAPNIALFGVQGARIGTFYNNNQWKLGQDDEPTIEVKSWNKNNGETPEYISVSAGGADAICISSITVTSAHTADILALLPGEVASVCNTRNHNYPWYPSDHNIRFKNPKTSTEETMAPKCLMIDVDGPRGDANIQKSAVPYNGFTAHLMDFKLDNSTFKSWEGDPGQMCDSMARFGMWEHMNEMQCNQIFTPSPKPGARLPMREVAACKPDMWHPDPYAPDAGVGDPAGLYLQAGREDPVKHKQLVEDAKDHSHVGCRDPRCRRNRVEMVRRALEERSKIQKRVPFHQRLVRSDNPYHSAIEVCEDQATRGPHFYSTREEMFCETDTHTLFPKCSNVHDDGIDCFDPEANTIMWAHGDRTKKRDTRLAYRKIHDWADRTKDI